MSDDAYYASVAGSMNLRIQEVEEQRDELLKALKAIRDVDGFKGWHPNYREAIELAEDAINKAEP